MSRGRDSKSLLWLEEAEVSKAWSGRRAQAVRASLAESLPVACWRCGRLVTEADEWDVGHVVELDLDPDSAYDPGSYAVEHRRCNRAAGARYANSKRASQSRPFRLTSREW